MMMRMGAEEPDGRERNGGRWSMDVLVTGAVSVIPGSGSAAARRIRLRGLTGPGPGAAGPSCYIGSSSKISTAHFPSLPARNGRPSVSAFAAARSSASTIV
jgi:hypothetical protein